MFLQPGRKRQGKAVTCRKGAPGGVEPWRGRPAREQKRSHKGPTMGRPSYWRSASPKGASDVMARCITRRHRGACLETANNFVQARRNTELHLVLCRRPLAWGGALGFQWLFSVALARLCQVRKGTKTKIARRSLVKQPRQDPSVARTAILARTGPSSAAKQTASPKLHP